MSLLAPIDSLEHVFVFRVCAKYIQIVKVLAMRTFDTLVEMAAEQHGLVDTVAVHAVGIPPATLTRYTKSGRLERIAHGVYRVPAIPEDRLTPYMEAVLWARGEAVISHASALEMLELCDVFPSKIHLSVPSSYRPRRAGGQHFRVHRQNLRPADVTAFSGVPVVTAYQAILQSADVGEDPEQLRLAVRNATKEGLLLRAEAARLKRRLK